MTTEQSRHMSGMHLVPYIQVATLLIGKSRQAGGNMFRHQIDTLGILIDYDYIDAVLLKASIVHDILEDIPYFDHNILLSVDSDSPAVYELVKEVSRRSGETKPEFLLRIRESGSHNAKILKVADRISNMISLGFVNDLDFVERYINETEQHVLPIAEQVSRYMVIELGDLIKSRRNYLKGYSMYLTSSQETSFMGFI